jgi:hypothetical protein
MQKLKKSLIKIKNDKIKFIKFEKKIYSSKGISITIIILPSKKYHN